MKCSYKDCTNELTNNRTYCSRTCSNRARTLDASYIEKKRKAAIESYTPELLKRRSEDTIAYMKSHPGCFDENYRKGQLAFWTEERRRNQSFLGTKVITQYNKRPETGDKVSIRMTNLWKLGHFKDAKIGRGKSGYYLSDKAGKILFRSSYELEAYKILDSDITVKSYLVEPFSIHYNDSWYKPDILVEYVNGDKVLIEVKAEWNVNSDSTRAKQLAAENYIINTDIKEYKIWTETTLFPILTSQIQDNQ